MESLNAMTNIYPLNARYPNHDKLWLNYQPIVDPNTHRLIGFEALLRSQHSPDRCPTELIESVRQANGLEELGRAIRFCVQKSMPRLPKQALVFVNLEPEELQGQALFASDEPLANCAHRIVLEITERAQDLSMRKLSRRVSDLRQRGFRVALDDLGAGHNGLAMLTSLDLDIVKLDMALIRDIECNQARQCVVEFLIDFCHQRDIQCLAEGIETESEHAWFAVNRIDLAQGYLYGHPERINADIVQFSETPLQLPARANG